MFEILDREGNVIETATTLIQAHDVVTHYMARVRTAAPYHCRPAA